MRNFRRKLAFIIFGIFLAWPAFHIVMVKNIRISSWRFFGWGMYATPTPDTQSRLRVVILNPSQQSVDPAHLHDSLENLNLEPSKESNCVNLFVKDAGQSLRRLPRTGLCEDDAVAQDLDYFTYFGSSKHLKKFINAALLRANQSSAEAYAFLTHQHFNIFQQKAYLESDVYRVSRDEVKYLGKIEGEGKAGERQNL